MDDYVIIKRIELEGKDWIIRDMKAEIRRLGVLLKWAQNKGVRSYVTDDEANDLAIKVIDELDDARARAKKE